ncbi:hypothetical protein B0J14DRAFT_611616 [Halenospora varia]|nr:hypothetical protein B0J14DRAFT_611616 [Halenospora varia]
MEYEAMCQDETICGSPESLVLLSRMPQQVEVRVADDDWTGRTAAAERRKLQNRLHQRTYRKRRKLQKTQGSPTDRTPYGIHSDAEELGPYLNTGPNNISQKDIQPFTSHGVSPTQVQEVIDRFEKFVSQEQMLGSPRADLLLTLIQFNVFRALVGNTFALGFTFDWLSNDAVSPFNHTDPNDYDCRSPMSLRSTTLQRTVVHHPWIDLFPIPTLRDNLLRRGESFDDEPLCHDLVEVCHSPSERSGLIIWGDPWNPQSWEVTEDFAQKWAWMLRGCGGLLQSTNFWREKRGEDELLFDISFPEPAYPQPSDSLL